MALRPTAVLMLSLLCACQSLSHSRLFWQASLQRIPKKAPVKATRRHGCCWTVRMSWTLAKGDILYSEFPLD